jgi:hypothetical protein
MSRRFARRSVTTLLLAFLATGSAAAQYVEDVFPYEPDDRAVVGPKPMLRVGVEGSDVRKMRFRIELSRDEFDTIAYTFDQMEERARWGYIVAGFEGPPGARFLVAEPLDNGEYEWRASAWNGVEWIEGKTTHRLTVDAVPPADVDRLSMSVDPDDGSVTLQWDPVTLDRNGQPEYVARYHVYRYKLRSFFFVIRPFRIATVEGTSFVDHDPGAAATPLLFYKVTAEDAAGNEPERKY